MQFLAAIEVRWFEPMVRKAGQSIRRCGIGAARSVLFEVECRKLDRLQAVDPEWTALALLLFVVIMTNIQLRPNPPISRRS